MLRSAAAGHCPPPLFPSASSWSTLSPLAPPFTVDRPLTPTSPPHHDSVYSWPPIPVDGSDWSTTAVEAAPYYPCYSMMDGAAAAEGGISSWMDPSAVFAGSAFQKGTAAEGFVENEDSWGPWHGKVVGSTGRKYHFGSERTDWLDDQHPAIHEEKVRAPCNISGTSVLGAGDLHKGNSYFHSKDPTSIMEEPNDYLNPCYDSYITQLVSCSTDAMVYYPDTYFSVQAYAPSATRANSSMDCWSTNICPTIPNTNHYKVKNDNSGHILGRRKEYSINQNDESKEGCIGRSSDIKTNIGNFVESSLTTKEFLLDSDLTTGNSTNSPTKVKAGLRYPHLNIPNPFPNEGSVNPDDLLQTSPETFDQLNHAVDSPCWKGASLSWPQYPLNVVEEIDPHSLVKELEVYPSLVKESEGFDDLVQNQKHAVSALITPEQDGNLIHMSITNSSYLSPSRDFSMVGSLPRLEKKSKDASKELSNYEKGKNAMGGLYSHVLGGQCIETLTDPKQDAEPKECGAKPLGHHGTFIFADQSILAGETNLNTGLEDVAPKSSFSHGSCSAPRNDSQVLLKAMLYLSEMLLSMYSADADELKEHDQDVVQLVVDNLKALIHKSKEGATKHKYLLSELVTGQSQVTPSKADIAMKCANNKSIQVSGKMQYTEPCMCSDTSDISLPKGIAKDFGSFSNMAKVLDKGFKESLHEQEENSQILLYKNLWIEAEVALCSLKHARLKLELEDHKNQKSEKPHAASQVSKKISPVSGSLNSMPVLDGHDVSRCKSPKHPCHIPFMAEDVVIENGYQKPEEANPNKASEVETSVMARFRALEVRDEKLSFTHVDDQGKLAVHSFQSESETNIGPKLHPAKLFDLGFTEGNLKSGYQKPEEANSIKPSDVGTSVMAPLRALKVRDEKLSSTNIEDPGKLDVDSSQPVIETDIGHKFYPAKLIDSGFMEGNLKSGYQKPEEANSSKAREVDTSVMDRFRALKIRDEKLSSPIIEDQGKLAVDSTQLERENNIGPKLHPANLTDLGFMEGNPNPYWGAEPRDGNILMKLRSDSQHIDANNEGNGLPPINSEHAVTRFSQIWTASGQPVQSYLSNGTGKNVFSDGYCSPSFEWEQGELVESSQPERENNIGLKLHPAKLADLGFMEGNPKTFCGAEPREGNILVKARSDSQLHGAHNEENVLSSINSEHAATILSQIWTDNRLPYQSKLSNEKGKYILSSGYDSSSSEWEHVFKEDFTWYNSHEES